MTDNLTKAQRKLCMSSIKRSHTKPELFLKNKIKDFEYQPKNAHGNPDFINYKKKIVLFTDGCFWHKCPLHYKEPKSNKSYWLPKLERNEIRDKEINKAYEIAGWAVIRLWEHELKLSLGE